MVLHNKAMSLTSGPWISLWACEQTWWEDKVVCWTLQVLPSSSLAALQRWDSPHSAERSELAPKVLKTQATPPQAVCPPAFFSKLL